jgi:hypothetical protein
MDKFDKRAIFYTILIFGIAIFFMIPYSDGIYHWNSIYEEAQESIKKSKEILEWRTSTYAFLYIGINEKFAELGSNLYRCIPNMSWEQAEKYNREHSNEYYDMILKVDSICLNWFDTIVIVKCYTNYSDTIKVALEDL